MRRTLAVVVLVGFLAASAVYLFIYLFRAFRLPAPANDVTVQVWHGDPMIRALLIAILFLIGLVLLLFVSISTSVARRTGSVQIRTDLWEWLKQQAEETNEDPNRIAERALAQYRQDVEGHTRSR